MKILITYTGKPLGINIAKIFKKELEKITDIKVKLFINSPTSEKHFSVLFGKETHDVDVFIMFITDEIKNKSSEWAEAEYGIIIKDLTDKSQKLNKNTDNFIKKHLFIMNVEDTDLSCSSIEDDKQTIYPFNFESLKMITDCIKDFIKQDLNYDIISNIYDKLMDITLCLDDITRRNSFKTKLRDINLKNLAYQINKFLDFNIKRLSKTNIKNEKDFFDESIDTMCHSFILKTLERTREDLKGLQGYSLPISRDYVKEFWLDSIMKESESVWATNIEDFSKSHGRQLKAELLKAQAKAILKGTQIKRIFIYSIEEVIDKQKRQKLFDVMLSQSLIGIQVYAIEDNLFNSFIEKEGGIDAIGGGRDFIVINGRALYITRNIGNEIQSTKLMLPNNKDDLQKIEKAKHLFNLICESANDNNTYKIEPELKYIKSSIAFKITKKFPNKQLSNKLIDILQKFSKPNLCLLIKSIHDICTYEGEFIFIISLLKKEFLVTMVNISLLFEKKSNKQIEEYLEKENLRKIKQDSIRDVTRKYDSYFLERAYSEDDIIECLRNVKTILPSQEEINQLKRIMYYSHSFENSFKVENINNFLRVHSYSRQDESIIGLIDMIEEIIVDG